MLSSKLCQCAHTLSCSYTWPLTRKGSACLPPTTFAFCRDSLIGMTRSASRKLPKKRPQGKLWCPLAKDRHFQSGAERRASVPRSWGAKEQASRGQDGSTWLQNPSTFTREKTPAPNLLRKKRATGTACQVENMSRSPREAHLPLPCSLKAARNPLHGGERRRKTSRGGGWGLGAAGLLSAARPRPAASVTRERPPFQLQRTVRGCHLGLFRRYTQGPSRQERCGWRRIPGPPHSCRESPSGPAIVSATSRLPGVLRHT